MLVAFARVSPLYPAEGSCPNIVRGHHDFRPPCPNFVRRPSFPPYQVDKGFWRKKREKCQLGKFSRGYSLCPRIKICDDLCQNFVDPTYFVACLKSLVAGGRPSVSGEKRNHRRKYRSIIRTVNILMELIRIVSYFSRFQLISFANLACTRKIEDIIGNAHWRS